MNVFTVAEYFLNKPKESKSDYITHLKLQKLVYYAQAWYVALEGKKLFDSDIVAWLHGPVSPEIYDKYREKGFKVLYPELKPINLPKKATNILDSVWRIYGSYDAKFLEDLIKSEKPYINAINNNPSSKMKVISVSDMRDYYTTSLVSNGSI